MKTGCTALRCCQGLACSFNNTNICKVASGRTRSLSTSAADVVGSSSSSSKRFSSHPVSSDHSDMRLDRWIKLHYPSMPHSAVCKLIRTRQISLTLPEDPTKRKRANASDHISAGSLVNVPAGLARMQVAVDRVGRQHQISREIEETIKKCVIYKDSDIIAINKPEGLAVQGGSGLKIHLDMLLPALRFSAAEDPRLVHRLDRETSGVLLLGRNRLCTVKLQELFKEKYSSQLRKTYWAIVSPSPKLSEGRIRMPLDRIVGENGEGKIVAVDKISKTAKIALTEYKVIDDASKKYAFIELYPETGRTHQLRVHCASVLKTPILGDVKYGPPSDSFMEIFDSIPKLHLHARRIEFPHPTTNKPICIEAPLPKHLFNSWNNLGFDPDYKAKSY